MSNAILLEIISDVILVFPKMVVPPTHPKMIIFSRKTHGCWVPAFYETPTKRQNLGSFSTEKHSSLCSLRIQTPPVGSMISISSWSNNLIQASGPHSFQSGHTHQILKGWTCSMDPMMDPWHDFGYIFTKSSWWVSNMFLFFLPGEMIQFDSYFSNGLVVQPPTRNG